MPNEKHTCTTHPLDEKCFVCTTQRIADEVREAAQVVQAHATDPHTRTLAEAVERLALCVARRFDEVES